MSKKWTVEDYVASFVEQKHPEYLTLVQIVKDTGIPIAKVLSILSYRTQQLQRGQIVIKPKEASIRKFFNFLTVLQGAYPNIAKEMIFDRYNFKALYSISTDERFSAERFLAKLKTQTRDFVRCTSKDKAIDMFTSIYNYRAKGHDIVEFAKD